jgi:ParB-like chromosome segregation protein Spo0J
MFGLTEAQWRDLVLSVNVHRKTRRLSPYQTSQYLAMALNHTNVNALGEALGFSDATTLLKILRLKDLPPETAPLVEWGTAPGAVSMSTAAELLRLASSELVAIAIKAAAQHRLTKEEARQLVQIYGRSGEALQECISRVLLTRPRVERSELIIGSLLSPEAQRNAAELGEEQSAKRLRLLLAHRFPDVVCQAVRVRAGRFSMLFSEEDAAKLRRRLAGRTLEAVATQLLAGTPIEE